MLLTQARAESGAPEGSGVRFFAHDDEANTEIRLSFVPQPVEGDQVSEQEGLPVTGRTTSWPRSMRRESGGSSLAPSFTARRGQWDDGAGEGRWKAKLFARLLSP